VDVAELFPHVRIVMGMVIGLGITRLLMGVAGLIQHPTRTGLSSIHLLWVYAMLVELVFFWWWQFALFEVTEWSFGIFLFLIGYAILLFLLAALLFPDKLEEYDGYEDFFLRRRHWFFGLFAATFVFDFIDTLIKGPEHFARVSTEYFIQLPVGLLLCAIAIWTPNQHFHRALVLFNMLYQAVWIVRLFYTVD
jgi:hypothetical protein